MDSERIRQTFTDIASQYDFFNHLLTGGIDLYWRHSLVRAVLEQKPAKVLDVATGSGDVALALKKHGIQDITGVDFCPAMLEQAKKKGFENVILSDALSMPFPDSNFDAVTISFGLRNQTDRGRALREMHRVLKPAGYLYILEFSQPYRWIQPLYAVHLKHILPRITGLLSGKREAYEYLSSSILEFPNHEKLKEEVFKAGFTSIVCKRLTLGMVALHRGLKR